MKRRQYPPTYPRKAGKKGTRSLEHRLYYGRQMYDARLTINFIEELTITRGVEPYLIAVDDPAAVMVPAGESVNMTASFDFDNIPEH